MEKLGGILFILGVSTIIGAMIWYNLIPEKRVSGGMFRMYGEAPYKPIVKLLSLVQLMGILSTITGAIVWFAAKKK